MTAIMRQIEVMQQKEKAVKRMVRSKLAMKIYDE